MVYSIGAEARTGDTTSTSCRKTAWVSRRVFLDEILNLKAGTMQEHALTEAQQQVLEELVKGDQPINLDGLVDISGTSTGKVRWIFL